MVRLQEIRMDFLQVKQNVNTKTLQGRQNIRVTSTTALKQWSVKLKIEGDYKGRGPSFACSLTRAGEEYKDEIGVETTRHER